MNTSFSSLRLGAAMVFPFDRPAAPPAWPGDGASTGSQLLMRVLDQLDYGVMLVTDHARVRFANRVALRECAGSHALRLVHGSLQARDERDQHALMRALAASGGGRRTLLTMSAQQPLLSVAIVPVHETASAPAAEPAALVVFGRRQVCEPLSVEFFARENRLTTAETGVLQRLAGGLRPSQIAREAGVAMSTVRTQITSIRTKTGARSIGELLRLVTVLPPIVPVLAS